MSHAHGSHERGVHAQGAVGEHKPHVLPLRIYLGVWGSLLVLTVITVAVSYHDYGSFNIIVAMAVATLKATLVTLFFMHLKYDEHFNVIVFVTSLIFLGVFFVLTMADTAERGKVDPLEARAIQLVPGRPELMEALGGGGGHGGAGDSTGHGGAGDSTGHGAAGDSTGHGADSTAAHGIPAVGDTTQAHGTAPGSH